MNKPNMIKLLGLVIIIIIVTAMLPLSVMNRPKNGEQREDENHTTSNPPRQKVGNEEIRNFGMELDYGPPAPPSDPPPNTGSKLGAGISLIGPETKPIGHQGWTDMGWSSKIIRNRVGKSNAIWNKSYVYRRISAR